MGDGERNICYCQCCSIACLHRNYTLCDDFKEIHKSEKEMGPVCKLTLLCVSQRTAQHLLMFELLRELRSAHNKQNHI